MNVLNIKAVDIPDAWFQFLYNLDEYGRKYTIQHGSFVGEIRQEYDFVTAEITNPYSEPYDLMLPQIPVGLNIPNPVENGYIEQYLPYLMTGEKKKDEDYTYGERLCNIFLGYTEWDGDGIGEGLPAYHNQINHWIKVLKKTPNTNQAVLQIAQPSDCLLVDPPCLRSIHCKVIDNKLVFYVYFRSNDLWGGFPANLAGIAVLQKYMADEIGVDIGSMIYFSSGLHVYGYCDEIVKIRTGKL